MLGGIGALGRGGRIWDMKCSTEEPMTARKRVNLMVKEGDEVALQLKQLYTYEACHKGSIITADQLFPKLGQWQRQFYSSPVGNKGR